MVMMLSYTDAKCLRGGGRIGNDELVYDFLTHSVFIVLLFALLSSDYLFY